MDRHRGRGALPRRGRHHPARRHPGRLPGSGRGGARRAAVALCPDPRPVPDAGPRPSLGPARWRRRRRARAPAGGRHAPARRVPPGRCRTRVVRSRRSSGCSVAARWRASGARSSRSTRRRWPASCPTGRGSSRSARLARRCARPLHSSGSPRSSTSWPGCRYLLRSSSVTCSRHGSPGYQPRLLDELGALGEVAWVGRGSLGRDDGRIALVRPGREILRPPGSPDGAEPPSGPRHIAIREHLATRGASFYREIFTAAHGTSDREVLDALWDLVWAGEVTNDTFAPLRALRWKRTGSGARRPGGRAGRLTALGPPEAAGRWSLVIPDPGGASATERLHAQSLALLDRHGVLTREAVATEGIDGGFAAVYPVLRAMEDAGRIRRGYFVDGLGAAQFALAGRARPAARRRATRPIRRRPARSTCWPPPTRPTRTARRSPGRGVARRTDGRSSVPRARTSCSSTASRPSISNAAGRRSRRSPPPTTRPWRSPRVGCPARARRRRSHP